MLFVRLECTKTNQTNKKMSLRQENWYLAALQKAHDTLDDDWFTAAHGKNIKELSKEEADDERVFDVLHDELADAQAEAALKQLRIRELQKIQLYNKK